MDWKFKIMSFLRGIFSNLIRFFRILLLAAVFMIIGISVDSACKDIGIIVFILYLLVSVLRWVRTEQLGAKMGVDKTVNMLKESNIITEDSNKKQELILDDVSFELNTEIRDTAFFVSEGDRGLKYSMECIFNQGNFMGENIAPDICIYPPIETTKKTLEDLAGEQYEVKVNAGVKREDSFYLYEHEPFGYNRLIIVEIKENKIHIRCTGMAIIDGCAQPYRTAPFVLDCWLPIITCEEDWEKLNLTEGAI